MPASRDARRNPPDLYPRLTAQAWIASTTSPPARPACSPRCETAGCIIASSPRLSSPGRTSGGGRVHLDASGTRASIGSTRGGRLRTYITDEHDVAARDRDPEPRHESAAIPTRSPASASPAPRSRSSGSTACGRRATALHGPPALLGEVWGRNCSSSSKRPKSKIEVVPTELIAADPALRRIFTKPLGRM